ncbi:cytochrome b/b6 domain-containing protein [Pseudolysinimonas sp.]|uniref:cytochrome b/b6 domain-containing protein n=1 Tax=Pseudolysinimonas sp. TaxID=2680009 RepID=UPI003F8227C9
MSATQNAAPRRRWIRLAWIIPVVVVVAAIVVFGAQWLRSLDGVRAFLTTYPGHSALPSWAPIGLPAWLQWQHGLSAFLMLFILRTGWLVRTTRRPDAFFTRRNTGPLRTKGQPIRIGLQLWFHLTLDALWVLNGLVFYVLIFSTGQWVRIVPTSWDVVPNALSAALQYASLNWPTEDGWVGYNALQLLSYFAVVFLMAPLAVLTGLRMTPGLAAWWRRFDRVYPLPVARRVHFPLAVLFAAFIVVHVFLVLATGALRNLNHMYAGRDDESWIGFIVFAAFIALCVAAWFALRPVVLRMLAGTMGTVGRR